MILKDFIQETITSILDGISEASKTHGDRVVPQLSIGDGDPLHGIMLAAPRLEPVSNIEFDVAVTASDTTEGKVGAGIKVLDIGFGSDLSGERQRSTVSRIKFVVPIRLK